MSITYNNFFLIGLLLILTSSLMAQTVKTVDFEYKEGGQWYQGSFDCIVNTRQSKDVLKNNIADFSGIDDKALREIYVRIGNLQVADPTHTKVKVYFDRRWRSSTITLNELGSSRKTITLLPKRYKSLTYIAEENGQASIDLGYSYAKKIDVPKTLKINFNINGIGGESVPTPPVANNTDEPTPATEEETANVEETAWQKTKAKGTKEAYYDFMQDYPNSKHIAEAKRRFGDEVRPTPTPVTPTPAPDEEEIITNESENSEETAWKKAKQKNTKEGYEKFIIAYPKSEFVGQAKQKIQLLAPIEVRITQEGNKYSVTYLNAVDPEIIDVFPSQEGLVMQTVGNLTKIVIDDKRKYTFTVKAKGGKTASFELDNAIPPLKGIVFTGDKILEYKAEGGIPPYFLSITDENGIVVARVNLPDSVGKIVFQELEENLNGLYTVDLLDSRKTIPITFSGIKIKQGGQGFIRLGLFIGLLLVLGALFFIVRHFYKKVHASDGDDDFGEEDYYTNEDEIIKEE